MYFYWIFTITNFWIRFYQIIPYLYPSSGQSEKSTKTNVQSIFNIQIVVQCQYRSQYIYKQNYKHDNKFKNFRHINKKYIFFTYINNAFLSMFASKLIIKKFSYMLFLKNVKTFCLIFKVKFSMHEYHFFHEKRRICVHFVHFMFVNYYKNKTYYACPLLLFSLLFKLFCDQLFVNLKY